jgi:hypothetical protein
MRTCFSGGRGSECSGVATEHGLYKNIGDVDVCTEFEMLKVEVPIIFLGTVGFSLLRDGRYFLFFIFILNNHCGELSQSRCESRIR